MQGIHKRGQRVGESYAESQAEESLCDLHPRSLLLTFVVAALLVLGVYFRFANLERRVYWYDEANTSLWISGHSHRDVERWFARHRVVPIEELGRYRHLQPQSRGSGIISNLAETEPALTPLYPLIALLWARRVGDSVASLRALSAAISLIGFPVLLWLCWELFGETRTGWFALALLAVSPLQVMYAQEACAYSLWIVVTMLSSAFLLAAVRARRRRVWMAYAATVTVGLYTHLFFVFVLLGHGVYVFLCADRTRRSYVIATLMGGLPFVPWVVNLAVHYDVAQERSRWVTTPTDLLVLVKSAALNFACVVFDVRLRDDIALYYWTLPILVLLAYSLVHLTWTRPRRVWIFLFALVGIAPLVFGATDLLFGGRRLTVTRYAFPCYLALQLALGALLASRIADRSNVVRWGCWLAVAGLLTVAGVISCLTFSQAETWWNKSVNRDNRDVARRLARSSRPLVVSDNAGMLLSLSYAVGRGAYVMLARKPELLEIPSGFNDVFVYTASEEYRQRLRTEEGLLLEGLSDGGHLWRIVTGSSVAGAARQRAPWSAVGPREMERAAGLPRAIPPAA